jgi:amino acid transporter
VTTNQTGSPGDHPVRGALRDLVAGSETRLALVLATVVVGAATAFILAFITQPSLRTFVTVAPLVTLIMSVLTPMSAAVLIYDLRDPDGDFRSRTSAPLRSRWIAAGVYGLLVGLASALLVALAVTVAAGSSPATDPWAGAAPAVIGSVLLQLIPVGVGCAAGLLLPRSGLAALSTVVVPLLVTLIVGLVLPRGTADWITPLGAAGHLVPGPMTALHWAQWIVTAALWVVLPNVIGMRRLRDRAARTA